MPRQVYLIGFQETVSVCAGRFRMPGPLVAALHQEMGRVCQPVGPRPLALYFCPADHESLALYPPPNIRAAIARFEDLHDLITAKPDQLRRARDYFYSLTTYIEADHHGQFCIPNPLREHAALTEQQHGIIVTARGHYIALHRRDPADAYKQEKPDSDAPIFDPGPPPDREAT